MIEEFVSVFFQEALPGPLFGDCALLVVRCLRSFVRHLQEQQIR